MSRNLREVNGKLAFAYIDTVEKYNWHGGGQKVGGAMTAEEAIVAGGLDFEVEKVPLRIDMGDTKVGPLAPGAFITRCKDTNEQLGIVGSDYTPLQNRIAFGASDILVDEGWVYKSVGAIGKGERVWILMEPKRDATYEIVKGDPIREQILFSNSHDGSSAVEVRDTETVVVCYNTFSAAIRGSKPAISLRHTQSIEQRIKLATHILVQHIEHHKTFKEAMTYLAKFPIKDDLVTAFENAMFGETDKVAEGRARTILTNKLEAFEECLVKGKGSEIPGRNTTAYGIVQSYVEWADYKLSVRGTEDRSNTILFGTGWKLKREAMDTMLALVKAR